MSRWVVAALLALACAPEGPLFTAISKITIQKVGATGLVRREVAEADLGPMEGCLYNGTKEVTSEQTSPDLLPTTFLIEITDRAGSRSFELYTAKNLKGNRGKYYENLCLYDQIAKMDL